MKYFKFDRINFEINAIRSVSTGKILVNQVHNLYRVWNKEFLFF
jgi:hypothetical protein